MNEGLEKLKEIHELVTYPLTESSIAKIKDNITIIETALKNYEELTSKPAILFGRTHGHTQALIDTICKNYKEIKITNLEDEKKLKALQIIKKKRVDVALFLRVARFNNAETYNCEIVALDRHLTQKEYDLLKEVMLSN